MNPTKPARIENEKKNRIENNGEFAPISEVEFRGIVKAFAPYLAEVEIVENGISRVWMLSSTVDSFLIETSDSRFFVRAAA